MFAVQSEEAATLSEDLPPRTTNPKGWQEAGFRPHWSHADHVEGLTAKAKARKGGVEALQGNVRHRR